MNNELPVDVPFQIEKLIYDMLNKKDNVHIRLNYRNRLDTIRSSIEKSIKTFDHELMLANTTQGKKQQKVRV